MEWRSAETVVNLPEEPVFGVWSREEVDAITDKDRNRAECHRQRLRRELKRREESRNGRVRKPADA